jgi:glyoxylase-like metal-dependent hydrolase (beta-lactamase superfamily II)
MSNANEMIVRFWGVRGSIPCADPQYMRYGGDTSCVSVEANGRLIIFDAGSGLRKVGLHAFSNGYEESHLFLSHVHIDHILGNIFVCKEYNLNPKYSEEEVSVWTLIGLLLFLLSFIFLIYTELDPSSEYIFNRILKFRRKLCYN